MGDWFSRYIVILSLEIRGPLEAQNDSKLEHLETLEIPGSKPETRNSSVSEALNIEPQERLKTRALYFEPQTLSFLDGRMSNYFEHPFFNFAQNFSVILVLMIQVSCSLCLPVLTLAGAYSKYSFIFGDTRKMHVCVYLC